MYLCLSECDMSECENGHIFHNSCVEINNDDNDDNDDDGYILEKNCPFCQLDILTNNDELKYLKLKYELTTEDITKEMKKKYGDLKIFHETFKK